MTFYPKSIILILGGSDCTDKTSKHVELRQKDVSAEIRTVSGS
jgi:hypothetical protein